MARYGVTKLEGRQDATSKVSGSLSSVFLVSAGNCLEAWKLLLRITDSSGNEQGIG